jgi:hypothetical protein
MTTAISAGILPACTFRAIASKFDPRPESNIPSFFMILNYAWCKCRKPHSEVQYIGSIGLTATKLRDDAANQITRVPLV